MTTSINGHDIVSDHVRPPFPPAVGDAVSNTNDRRIDHGRWRVMLKYPSQARSNEALLGQGTALGFPEVFFQFLKQEQEQ